LHPGDSHLANSRPGLSFRGTTRCDGWSGHCQIRGVVSGVAPDQATKEKIALCCGNVHSVAKVDDRLTVAQPAPAATLYEVKTGDSLSKIAKAVYGDANAYLKIFEANKPMLSDPNKIYPGQQLRIPPKA
jgi:nucleoid-associated protein YgaU